MHFALLCTLCIVAVSGSTTPRFISYNSSDLSYLSNGIQFPVPEALEKDAIVDKSENAKVPEMQWLRYLYDHHHWSQQLDKITDGLCKQQMTTYLEELKNGTSWAVKMFDASGRYTLNFFFGNDFWLGSRSLCEELGNVDTNKVVPPFAIQFSVAKIRLNINEQYTPVTRQIIIGQCLPKSCNTADLRSVFLQEKSQAKSLAVIEVRPVPGDYNLINDKKFHIIGGVTLLVALLITISTIVEIFLQRNKSKSDVEQQNNNNNDSEQKKISAKKENKLLNILLSFSALTNGEKILSLGKITEDSIGCVHGLRFFSIVWIIMVHTYLEVFSISDNKTMRTLTERSFFYQTVSNATFSVDTFFLISGLLVTMTYFRSSQKSPPKTNLPCLKKTLSILNQFTIMVVYRVLRLTPAYLFVIGVNELVARFTQSNSVYSPAMIDHITCDLFWWRNALYINNFYPQHEFCMLWSWYIANDTQFYVLATILLVFAVRGQRNVKLVGVSILVFLVTSWITTFIVAMKYNYVARVEEPFALFDQLYDKPWLRIGPYLIGMFTGYFLFKKTTPLKLPIWAILSGWTLSLACLISVVYGIGRDGLIVPTSAIYASLGHTAWGLSIAWLIVICSYGYGGPINALLSFRGFLPFSRLTYCAYLIHPVIMVYTSFLLDGTIHLQQLHVLVIFLGNCVVSFMIAFIISLAFEAPIVRLWKVLFS